MSEHPPFLDKLNEEQRRAAMCIEGPVMIIAGAGSGKTRVLTYRIAYMLHKGIDPFNILALTFTNKAAREMKSRIGGVVGAEAQSLWMGTFHSIFARVLRTEAEHLGYQKDFTIYDTEDAKSLLKSIVKEFGLDSNVYRINLIYSRISNCKNSLINAKDYKSLQELMDEDNTSGRKYFYKVFEEYQDRCFKANAMDFDDLLLNFYKLLVKFPNILYKYQHKFRYIMVDEYQDTNLCQFLIVKKLAAAYQNLCVVGDDAQSIYGFRGATIQNILSFQKDYPDLKVFKLEHNYRSTKNIVNASTSVINKNKDRLEKNIYTNNSDGDKIKVIKALSDNEEGRLIAQDIAEVKNSQHLNNNQIAILYRTNAQSRSIEEALRKLNIPYKIYGGISFYQRKDVKDLIAYLRLTVNPNDEEALKRIINYPNRKIGDVTVGKISYLANTNQTNMWQIIANAKSYSELGSAAVHIHNFYIMMANFQHDNTHKNAFELAEYVAKQSTLLPTLLKDKTHEGLSRVEDVEELLNSIKVFVEDDTSEEEKTLSNFLQSIALYTDADEAKDEDTITLMTVHSSKGLEFRNVYVAGLEENLFPSALSLDTRQDLEEERRLFYVAITRAEKNLTLSFATSRFKYGNLITSEVSRFIQEIDLKYLDISEKTIDNNPRSFSSHSDSKYGKGYGMQVGKLTQKPLGKIEVSANFTPSDNKMLFEGCLVEHQMFGRGTVTKLAEEGENRKAVIEFKQAGVKTLVLKFAKLMIINE